MGAHIARRQNRVAKTVEPRCAVSQISVEAAVKSTPANWLTSTLGLGLLGSLLVYASLPPLDLVAAGLDCAGAVVAVGSTERIERPAAVSRAVDCRLRAVAGGDPLAAVAALDDLLRLAGTGVLFGVLRSGVRRADADCRASIGRFNRGGGAGRLHRLGIVRGHLLSGFTMGSLAHTQIHWLQIIQAADVVGCYGISGLIMLVAACVARAIPWGDQKIAFWPILPLVAACRGHFGTANGEWRGNTLGLDRRWR